MRNTLLLSESYLTWHPVVSLTTGLGLICLCLLVWVCLRTFWGPSQVRHRIGLVAIRAVALAIIVTILMGPTIVDEQAGPVSRPELLYLFDGSQSMQLGQEQSRWDQSLHFVGDAETDFGADGAGNIRAFRFGHRLLPFQPTSDRPAANSESTEPVEASTISLNSQRGNAVGSAGDRTIAPPDASDSRLADALRQLLPQVSSNSSAGVILLSDGRVRASESVEQLADLFGQSAVPIHVVPVGESSGSGDVAIVSLVVPTRVRKFSEHELQVFLRSFGFAGQRTTVRVQRRSARPDDKSATLASLPITLSGGAQSATLTFHVADEPEELLVVVDPLAGELTERNNRVETAVGIDRTKVRVLSLNAERPAGSSSFLGSLLGFGNEAPAPAAGPISLANVLHADEDIECTTLVNVGGGVLRSVSPDGSSSATAFPRTRAELFAYDCLILAGTAPDVLEPEQMQWIAQWVEGRGGGLIVTGAEALRPDAWDDSPLTPLLPIVIQPDLSGFPAPAEIDITLPSHPVWRLRMESQLNQQLLDKLPPLAVGTTAHPPKTTADVLAVRRDDQSAVLTAHRVGRGRVLVSTASLSGRALEQLANTWGAQPERVAGKFWRNLVYWATEGSSIGRRRLVAESDKRFYRPGEELMIVATAYDEAARRTQKYRVRAMFEPESLDDMSLYSPILWPDNVVRESGEVAPRIAWGEELPLTKDPQSDDYIIKLMLSETGGVGDSGMRIEMTAYEGEQSASEFDYGTQVDSSSLAIQILSDPFEQQNPLPNRELLERVATLSGGQVLEDPAQLAELLESRPTIIGPPAVDSTPAWSRWWLWLGLLGVLTTEWVWRRLSGLA